MPRCETEGNVQRTGEREVKVVGEFEEARPLRTDETAGIGSKDLVSRSCSISLKINRWSSARMRILTCKRCVSRRASASTLTGYLTCWRHPAGTETRRFVCPRGLINCYHATLFSVFRLPRPASELHEMAAVIG
jgi:hypothetical protein